MQCNSHSDNNLVDGSLQIELQQTCYPKVPEVKEKTTKYCDELHEKVKDTNVSSFTLKN